MLSSTFLWKWLSIKWWYLLEFFYYFFKILIFQVVNGIKGHAPYFKNHASYDCHLWHTCIKWYLSVVFSFFLNFDFLGFQWGKGAKKGPKFCLLHSISEEQLYIVWLSFVVGKCKMIVSPVASPINSKFLFLGLLGGSEGKKWS